MKHNFRKVIAASVASLAIITSFPMQNITKTPIIPVSASAGFTGEYGKQTAEGFMLYYALDDSNNTCQIVRSDVTTSGATVTLTDTVTFNGKTYTVVSIGPTAFRNNKNLRHISGTAKHITRIESGAFMGCENLWDLELYKETDPAYLLEGSVEYIGDSAFKDCTGLKSIFCLENAKDIGAWAFWGANLGHVWLHDVYSIGEAAFYNSTIISFMTTGSHLESIPDFAFCNCDYLSIASVDNSVKTIGKQAYANCDRLTDVILPASVKTIDTGAFMNCPKLTGAIAAQVEEVKDHAFFNCPKMTGFQTNNMDVTFGDYAMGYCYYNKLIKNPKFTIYAPGCGSTETYAKANHFTFYYRYMSNY
ncbi:MAG: leucine-rich repeat protein [Ruminococcus sp.]|nr:leucine-rich repeat protein [Ruminococcus sp.]